MQAEAEFLPAISSPLVETTTDHYEEIEREHQGCENQIPLDVKLSRNNKSLLEFRCRLEYAIVAHKILGKEKGRISSIETENSEENLRDLTLWGVPLLPSKGHEATDVVLTKFLKAKDFKVCDAFNMLQRTLKWRTEMKIDQILEENLGDDLEKWGYIGSKDKKGHPLCFNAYGIYKNIETYKEKSGRQEKGVDFFRWNIQLLEKCTRTLDLKPGGVNSVIWIVDLKHAPNPAMMELPFFRRKVTTLFRDYYPGIVYRYVIINVPLWVLAYHAFQLRLLTQRSKSKLIFVRPYRVTETLLKFIAPENLPVEYGGLKRENEDKFSCDDKVLVRKVRANCMENIRIRVGEAGMTVYWDVMVVGYEVSYKEEFIPDDDCSYRILVNKEKKMGKSVRNSFHIREPGTIVLSIENATFKKKLAFYRYSIKPTVTNLTFLTKEDR